MSGPRKPLRETFQKTTFGPSDEPPVGAAGVSSTCGKWPLLDSGHQRAALAMRIFAHLFRCRFATEWF